MKIASTHTSTTVDGKINLHVEFVSERPFDDVEAAGKALLEFIEDQRAAADALYDKVYGKTTIRISGGDNPGGAEPQDGYGGGALLTGTVGDKPEPPGPLAPDEANAPEVAEPTIAPPEQQAEIAAVVAATPEQFLKDHIGVVHVGDKPKPTPELPADIPPTPLAIAVLQSEHQGVRVVSIPKETAEFTYAKRVDGWVIKFDNKTGQEVARQQTAVQTTVAPPKAEATPPAAAPPPVIDTTVSEKRAGLDPDAARRAYAEKAGVPTSVSEVNTLREAVVAAYAHLGSPKAEPSKPHPVTDWMVTHAEHIPGCAGIPADKLAERVERIAISCG